MEWGREQPPGFQAAAVPRPSRRVAHAPVSVSRSLAKCSGVLRAICTCIVTAFTLQIARGSRRTFDSDLATVLALLRTSHRERRAVLGIVKALRSAPTRCAGLRALTTPARSSKVTLM